MYGHKVGVEFTIEGIYSVSSSIRTILAISGLLVERDGAIDIAINSVTGIDSIEGLCVVSSEAEIPDILRKSIYVVVLQYMC